ncbi:hypothetical protein [Paraburkholderia terricola]|uniref:hypothetical protein n=1 Tax=Paraburkholderia terricola TaxID=169427 RepID=UPI003ED0F74D
MTTTTKIAGEAMTDDQIIAIYDDFYTQEDDRESAHILPFARALLASKTAVPTLPQSVIDALRFYAHGHHFNINGDHQQFDTVSGEPQNWLMSERDDDCTMIEDGSIAKAALLGGLPGFEEPTEPLDGEVFAATPTAPAQPCGEDATEQADEAVTDSPTSQIATITKDLIETLMLWNGQASAGLDISGLAGLRDELVELAARAKDSK